jgi:hypothetical protein
MKVYFLIVGILITLVGLYLLYRRIYFLLHAQSAKGKVVSYEVRSFDDDSQDFYPVIRFSLEDGQEVPILYLPSRPQDAFIHSFLHFWAAPLGFLVLGSAGIATMFVG